ncbi:PEP/pyruvate-binding domain-containing protein [Streptomyces flavofungini]|uniref:PEP/pyruvate-binding domain-containing protein n=1 Tax=Streptomyces flavofungini TaxID=68200 RepID=UPI0025B101C2|nr:PEP/pyruvate-binding domain-containing protein [Streptomyces flavofungini]WJV50389.1 PEP/pyruvate-binding domain-containing protein [Streptomyces flavofungini]
MIEVDGDRLAVIALDARRARDARIAGAKAAHLARAAGAGLPVLPGFVVAVADGSAGAHRGESELRHAWDELSDAGARPLVVRSSSAHEDGAESSLAGLFETVLDVHGWDAFTDAVRRVRRSAHRVPVRHVSDTGDAARADPAEPADMAVLVQPMVRAVVGGVMFGADPLAGRNDRVLVSAVPGGPDRLVDGSVDGVRYHLTRHARLVRTEPAEPRGTRLLDRGRLRRLVRLARLAQREFGGPQDIEFGFDTDDRLWLFQTRPITAMPSAPPRGARLLGPGPVAETFPGVVQPLEEDLWLAPMSYGLTLALDLTGSAPRGQLRRLPVVTTVDGRAAADLRLLGAAPARRPVLAFLNPAPGARRAAAAWRTGRLRAALPMLAVDLMADVDRYLSELPPPDAMLSGRLFAAVSWGRTVLASLHAQESLAGALLAHDSGATAVGEALAVLSEARATAPDDARLVARHPVLLSLLPPSLGPRPPLPARTAWAGVPRGTAALPAREGLRLRIRWVQEMQTAMVREIALRFTAAGLIDDPARAALLRWSELTAASDGAGLPADLPERLPRPHRPALPAAFRLAAGRPVPAPVGRRGKSPGQGAGGGFGSGAAWYGEGAPPRHPVLVVRTLDPAFAPLLPGLTGLVAETGSVLSHLAVLAREYGVPTVVGVPDAFDRFPEGTRLSVNGGTGEVDVVRVSAVAEPADTGVVGTAGADADRPGGVDALGGESAERGPGPSTTGAGPDVPSSSRDGAGADGTRGAVPPDCPDYREGMAS